MNTNYPSIWRCLAAILSLSALIFIAGCNSAKNPVSGNIDKTSKQICAQVDISAVKNAIALSSQKQVIMNIYPVKHSADMKKNDFGLAIFFQDALKNGSNLGNQVNEELFKKEYANYMGFLKGKNISPDEVTLGYQVGLDSSVAKQMQVPLCIATVPGSGKDGKGIQSQYLDLLPKVLSDSCRCPPDCPCTPMLWEDQAREVIYSIYHKEIKGMVKR